MKSPQSRPVVIRPTTLAEAQGLGLEQMIHLHHEEVMRDGLPLVINWAEYRRLERAGEHRSLAAFEGSRLVGYNAFFVHRPLHHATSLVAYNDVLYVDPDHKNWTTGPRLLKEAETWLKAAGVRRIIYAAKAGLPETSRAARLSDLLRKLGYTDSETILEKVS